MSPQIQLQLPLTQPQDLKDDTLPIDNRFDSELANELARLESFNKHLYRPNSYLHKWWARRCGSTFRLILKSLIKDEFVRDYYTPSGLEGTIILDPMMGGGTTLHEAIRLGANVIGCDIDPIPVVQARATLTHVSINKIEDAFFSFYNSLREKVSPFFITSCPICHAQTELKYTLYGIRQNCNCSAVIVVDSLNLRHEHNGRKIHLCPKCHSILENDSRCHCSDDNYQLLVEKKTKQCEKCKTSYREALDTPFYSRYYPLVIVGECPSHGLFFKKPEQHDLDIFKSANCHRHIINFQNNDNFKIKSGPKSSDLIRRNVASYLELFSSRQLLYLHYAVQFLPKFDEPIRRNLALLVSTSLEFNSMLCGYKGADKRRPGAIRHTFSHHAYSFPYTALENNPIFPEHNSGTLKGLFEARITKARQWALEPKERRLKESGKQWTILQGEIDSGTEINDISKLSSGSRRFILFQGSSTSLKLKDDSVDYIVTDPPYFDNVQYSDLAKFFHVWLKQMLPCKAEWEYDVNCSAVGQNENGEEQYEKVLSGIFIECHRVIKKNGRFIFTFHHWKPRAWAAVTLALQKASFSLVNYYVVCSENPTSVHISNLKSLKHDVILVTKPTETNISKNWEKLSFVDRTDSKSFCEGCAKLLGWMLNEGIEENKIKDLWDSALSL